MYGIQGGVLWRTNPLYGMQPPLVWHTKRDSRIRLVVGVGVCMPYKGRSYAIQGGLPQPPASIPNLVLREAQRSGVLAHFCSTEGAG